mgnify:CR=1 FL=1
MTEKQIDTPKTSQKWRHRLLVGSLALNLLVVGAVVGGAVIGNGPGGPQRFDLTVGPLTRAMEGEHRDAVHDRLRESGAFQRADRAGMREDTAILLATLRAENFDEAAFRAALSRQRVRLQAGQDALLDAVTSEIETMSAEQRSAFADRIEDQAERRRPARRD